MRMQHTPGPWIVDMEDWGQYSHKCQIRPVRSDEVAVAYAWAVPGKREVARANARLIAVAPDLLEVLKELTTTLRTLPLCEYPCEFESEGRNFCDCVRCQVMDAEELIRQAEGRAVSGL